MNTEQNRHRALNAVLQGIAAAVVCASGASAAPVVEYQSTLDLPRGTDRAGRPVSVTVANEAGVHANGPKICVTDALASTGIVYDGGNVREFTLGLGAGLVSPLDVTVLGEGGFACTDGRSGGGRTIRCFNFFGEPVAYEPAAPRDGWSPEHLLVTRDGNYVTTDPGLGLLAKHDAATGSLLWEKLLDVEQAGEILGLGRPAEAPDGRIYVPLGRERRIAVLSAEGESLESFGASGTGVGRLTFPVGIAFCPDGNIAVLDRMRAVVLLYGPSNDFQAEFGHFGGGPGEFYHPTAIAATPGGSVYVAQGYLGRVQVFRYVVTGAARSMTINHSGLAEAGTVRAFDSHREGEGCL